MGRGTFQQPVVILNKIVAFAIYEYYKALSTVIIKDTFLHLETPLYRYLYSQFPLKEIHPLKVNGCNETKRKTKLANIILT